ncbi:hypothetical protein TeGR_g10807, partial [Tetraparma gracilis]
IRLYKFGDVGFGLAPHAKRSIALPLVWTQGTTHLNYGAGIRAMFPTSDTMFLFITNAGAKMCPHTLMVLRWLLGWLMCIPLCVRREMTINVNILPSDYSAMQEIAAAFKAKVLANVVGSDIMFESRVVVWVGERQTENRSKYTIGRSDAAPGNATGKRSDAPVTELGGAAAGKKARYTSCASERKKKGAGEKGG